MADEDAPEYRRCGRRGVARASGQHFQVEAPDLAGGAAGECEIVGGLGLWTPYRWRYR
jgi:hypothetical protein